MTASQPGLVIFSQHHEQHSLVILTFKLLIYVYYSLFSQLKSLFTDKNTRLKDEIEIRLSIIPG